MSLERVLNTLVRLGLSRTEAEIYVFLARKGPQRKDDIISMLKIPDERMRLSLTNLQEKGVVASALKHDTLFSAVPFEKAIDSLAKTKIEEAKRLTKEKEYFL